MLKKYLLLLLLLLLLAPLVSSALADELPEDCEAAVDAADRLGANPNKHCDYSNTGLNGVLHQTFNKNRAAKPLKVAATESGGVLSRSREFDSAQQLSSARFELLQLAATDCAAGFTLDDERYLPVAEKRLQLELHYHCH